MLDSNVPIPLQSGARCCPKTCRTEGNWDDRRVLEDTMNRESRENETCLGRDWKFTLKNRINFTGERKAEISERKVTTAKKRCVQSCVAVLKIEACQKHVS